MTDKKSNRNSINNTQQ